MTLLEPLTRWSASDLADYFTCAHRAVLERAARAGTRERPAPSGEAAVIARRGVEHAAAYRAQLAAEGCEVVELAAPLAPYEYAAAAAATLVALRRGAGAVAHATLECDGFVGVADLVVRVPGRSSFGAWTYEAVDVTLAHRSQPAAVIQLCAYAEALAALCGSPFDAARVRVARGDGTVESFRVADFAALYRAVRERFLVARDTAQPTRPEKIAACARCSWREACASERAATDDLSLVANIRREQILTLRDAGIATVAELAAAEPERKPPPLAAATWEKLRDQAGLQAAAQRDGIQHYHLLPPDTRSGFALLPPPAAGDLYFDMEGDPFVAGGSLEYLFGIAERDADGSVRFTARWAHDRAAERAVARQIVDAIVARRNADPAMHVYHYAAYERTALSRLCLGSAHEARLEELFRDGVFVDLYAVVRGALRVSTPSYSIKMLELFYRGTKRGSEVADAIGSVVAYEEYLRSGDQHWLDEIEVYNRDDCLSTMELQAWLWARRDEAYALYGAPQAAVESEAEAREASDDAELVTLRASLAGAGSGEALLADLLEYHRREARAGWREFFERCRTTSEELIDDPACLAGLVPDPTVAPLRIERSWGFALRFPAQRHRLRVGEHAADARTRKSAGEIVALTTEPDGSGTVVLKRGRTLGALALPTALVPNDAARDDEQRKALRRFAQRLAAGGGCDDAQGALLFAREPRLRGGRRLDDVDPADPAGLATLVDALERSALVVQGPPGTGKTWLAARAIVALLERGRRIGVAAGTHKAINNLLGEIERVAAQRDYPLRGMKKSDDQRVETRYDSPSGAIVDEGNPRAFPPDAAVRVIAGTPALFAREAMAGTVDVLFVDEAGQLALADALALAAAGGSIVLLGDPQQLPHVTTGAHPSGADASVLAHLLGTAPTVPAGRGVFLPRSYRMHSAVMAFVSELMYEGRLESAPACDRQRVVAPATSYDGAGLRALGVPHRGCSNASPAEAAAIADALSGLRAASVVGVDGEQRPFELARDAIVVAPYNAQVAAIRAALAAVDLNDVRVGTVDKFQGQEATVVFYLDDDLQRRRRPARRRVSVRSPPAQRRDLARSRARGAGLLAAVARAASGHRGAHALGECAGALYRARRERGLGEPEASASAKAACRAPAIVSSASVSPAASGNSEGGSPMAGGGTAARVAAASSSSDAAVASSTVRVDSISCGAALACSASAVAAKPSRRLAATISATSSGWRCVLATGSANARRAASSASLRASNSSLRAAQTSLASPARQRNRCAWAARRSATMARSCSRVQDGHST